MLLSDLLQSTVQVLLIFWGSSQKKNFTGVLQQRDDTQENKCSNEERANGVSDQPAELSDEDGRDDNTNAA